MAWNEPGNNGNDKDPWNNKGGKDQGPPDLDEVMRKFGTSLAVYLVVISQVKTAADLVAQAFLSSLLLPSLYGH